jgi:Transposase DDE domain group 1
VAAQRLYEQVYCARGDMENRIKECQLDLFADRTSAATMRANQLRLWFASMAYGLLCALRRLALEQTPLAAASCGTIRRQLLKIGALVRTSVRRVTFAMASGRPLPKRVRARSRAAAGRRALTTQSPRAAHNPATASADPRAHRARRDSPRLRTNSCTTVACISGRPFTAFRRL